MMSIQNVQILVDANLLLQCVGEFVVPGVNGKDLCKSAQNDNLANGSILRCKAGGCHLRRISNQPKPVISLLGPTSIKSIDVHELPINKPDGGVRNRKKLIPRISVDRVVVKIPSA